MAMSAMRRSLSQALHRDLAAALRPAPPAALAAPAAAAASRSLDGAEGRSWPLPSLAAPRAFHSAPAALASLQVTIPPLGESITDGTVAAVLKKVGDPVEEDEPIVQIETDKVTIDVRAPRAGVIEAILVRQDDNVNVGHVVASIAEGAAAGSVEGSPAPAASPKQGQAPHQAPAAAPPAQQPGQPPLQAAAPAAAATPPPPPPPLPPSGHARISFPPRRTPSGEVISMLPAAAAAEALRRAAAAAAGPRSDSAEPSAEHSFLARLRAAAAARAPQVPRQQISDWEMERIMLGGADP